MWNFTHFAFFAIYQISNFEPVIIFLTRLTFAINHRNKIQTVRPTGAKPVSDLNCMIPYIKIDGIIQFKSKTYLAPVVRPFYQIVALALRLFFNSLVFNPGKTPLTVNVCCYLLKMCSSDYIWIGYLFYIFEIKAQGRKVKKAKNKRNAFFFLRIKKDRSRS